MRINKGFIIGCLIGLITLVGMFLLGDQSPSNVLPYFFGGVNGLAVLAAMLSQAFLTTSELFLYIILIVLAILIPGFFGYLISRIYEKVNGRLKKVIIIVLMFILYLGLNIFGLFFGLAIGMSGCC